MLFSVRLFGSDGVCGGECTAKRVQSMFWTETVNEYSFSCWKKKDDYFSIVFHGEGSLSRIFPLVLLRWPVVVN